VYGGGATERMSVVRSVYRLEQHEYAPPIYIFIYT